VEGRSTLINRSLVGRFRGRDAFLFQGTLLIDFEVEEMIELCEFQ
jgi:hypothetical protein